MKTALDDGVTRVFDMVFEQYETKHKIQKFQDDLLEHQVLSLTRGVAMSAQQIHAEREHLGLYRAQIQLSTGKAASSGRKVVQ